MSSVRNLLARALRKASFKFDPPASQAQINDEFITWLCFANAGMLERGNLHLMDLAMKQLPGGAPILEIGSFCGLSTNLLTHFKRKYGLKNRLITCDKWVFENASEHGPHIGTSPVLFSDYREFVRNSYLQNIRLFSADDLPFTVEATSDEFFSAWRDRKETSDVLGRAVTLGGPISFCYIDGDHTYEGVKKDFLNCDAFLDSGGFLLFDDSTVQSFGVRDLMPEITAAGRYELVATNPNHLFQKVSG